MRRRLTAAARAPARSQLEAGCRRQRRYWRDVARRKRSRPTSLGSTQAGARLLPCHSAYYPQSFAASMPRRWRCMCWAMPRLLQRRQLAIVGSRCAHRRGRRIAAAIARAAGARGVRHHQRPRARHRCRRARRRAGGRRPHDRRLRHRARPLLSASNAAAGRAHRRQRRAGLGVPARHRAARAEFSAPQPHHQRPRARRRWWSRRPRRVGLADHGPARAASRGARCSPCRDRRSTRWRRGCLALHPRRRRRTWCESPPTCCAELTVARARYSPSESAACKWRRHRARGPAVGQGLRNAVRCARLRAGQH